MAWMEQELASMAQQLCDGHIVWTLEGGYELDVLAYGILNSFYAMLGENTIADPLGSPSYPERPIDDLIARLP